VDYSEYQETGPISREMALEPFGEKWRGFGFGRRILAGFGTPRLLSLSCLTLDLNA